MAMQNMTNMNIPSNLFSEYVLMYSLFTSETKLEAIMKAMSVYIISNILFLYLIVLFSNLVI